MSNRHDIKTAANPGALEKSLEKMKGRLYVARVENWEDQWAGTIGMKPEEFYEMMARNLPDDTHISIEFTGGGQADYTMYAKQFSLEGLFSRHHGTLTMSELRVDEGCRRQGIGKTILANHITLGEKWGLKTINLRGGREDGPFFWSRRGATLEDHPGLKAHFVEQVKENAGKLALPPETKHAVEEILSSNDISMNFRLATLGHKIDGTPVGVLLLKETNPRVIFDLSDKAHLNLIKNTL